MKEVYAPTGSQLAFYPMEECTVAAGYKNAKYRRDYGYVHYGVKFAPWILLQKKFRKIGEA